MLSSTNSNYYRSLIVKHFNKPENLGLLNGTDSITCNIKINSCVDNFQIELTIINELIKAAKFSGVGCTISTASIDIYCNLITNKTINELMLINKNYLAMLNESDFDFNIIVDLRAFQMVLKQKSRLKCALIISEAITKIINAYQEKLKND